MPFGLNRVRCLRLAGAIVVSHELAADPQDVTFAQQDEMVERLLA